MKSALFFSFFMFFFFSTTASFANTPKIDHPKEVCIEEKDCPTLIQPWNFTVTVGYERGGAYIEITFKVHCESNAALAVWINSYGAFGCDVAQGITNPNGKGGSKNYQDREALIRAMEDMANLERGTLEYIKVKKSTAFKAEGKIYKIVPGKYLLDREKNYPLIFPFKLEEVKSTELNKDLMRKKETSQLRSFSKIGND